MLPGKYTIRYASYPWSGCWDGEYATDSFLAFVFKFAMLSAKYPIVDIQFRDNAKMDELRGDAE